MAELACLTGRAGGAKEVLPALEYLAHPVATLPLDGDSLDAAAATELVVVDATRDLSRAQLLQEVWGYDFFGGTRTVDVHVRRLRAKLGPEHESMIATVRGVGYKLLPADQARAEREAGE